jgi:hypothetical protein
LNGLWQVAKGALARGGVGAVANGAFTKQGLPEVEVDVPAAELRSLQCDVRAVLDLADCVPAGQVLHRVLPPDVALLEKGKDLGGVAGLDRGPDSFQSRIAPLVPGSGPVLLEEELPDVPVALELGARLRGRPRKVDERLRVFVRENLIGWNWVHRGRKPRWGIRKCGVASVRLERRTKQRIQHCGGDRYANPFTWLVGQWASF